MQKLKNYLTSKGWKADVGETRNHLKDIGIAVRRTFKSSDNWYQDLTSEERKELVDYSTSLIFPNEREFQRYMATNIWPLGPCLIYEGKKYRKFDDTTLF